jgi:hypothetical protein
LKLLLGLGLACTVHAVPFQGSIRVEYAGTPEA